MKSTHRAVLALLVSAVVAQPALAQNLTKERAEHPRGRLERDAGCG